MWTQTIFCGRESTVVEILILYLPNLRSITISISNENSVCLKHLISNINTANRIQTQKAPTPLSKLSHLNLESRHARNVVFDNSLHTWLPIDAGLPSLRRLSGNAVNGHRSNRSKPCSGTELTDIDVTSSDIDVRIFKYLLSGTKALQTFTYSYESLPHTRASWDPGKTVQLLQIHAAHSLEILDPTNLSGNGLSNTKPDTTFVDCLKNFRVFKQVRLDHGMLIENPPRPRTRPQRHTGSTTWSWDCI